MTQRKLTVALFASAALNLFLVGAVVGGLLAGGHERGRRHEPRRGGPPLWAAGQALSPEHREAYGQMLRNRAPGSAEDFREARRLRARAWQAMTEPAPDPAAVKADLGRARALDASARGELEERIVDFAMTLPAAERSRLAEQLATPARRERRER